MKPAEKYTLKMNGETVAVEATPDMPLLWVIRDLLGLTGTKFGCGIAQCRACTVHVDGVETTSCRLPVSRVGSAEVTTIEGLGERPLRALEAAWIAEEVPQCGYCQVGQVMAAAALLARNPDPGDADIDAAMLNICRCGTYNRIRRAIKRAAKEMR
jgi:isoquinoline 1-oxidoreductase subunit alpha